MHLTPDDLKKAVLEKLTEAEVLVRYTMTHPKEQSSLASIRWFIVADETTALILQATEHLSEEDLLDLQQQVRELDNEEDKNNNELWNLYKENPRRFQLYAGKEIGERDDI